MTRRGQASEIAIRQDQASGYWFASAVVDGSQFKARGDSSVQAHTRLLEKIASAPIQTERRL